ncbi:MAG: DUF4129 domain-containing protein [Mycobacterium sp.]
MTRTKSRAARVALVVALLLAAAVALRGRIPDLPPTTRAASSDDPASLAGVIALLGVSMVVMAFAVFLRRPQAAKAAAFEMRDFAGGGGGRLNVRLVLIALGLVLLWLAVFVAISQFRLVIDVDQAAPTPTAVPDSGQPVPSAPPKLPQKPKSGVYQVLAIGTGVLLVMMVAATVVAALRNRSKLPPVVITDAPGVGGSAGATPLAAAAERGLAEVSNLGLAPREAIIACYAAMEDGLAGRPGSAPQASDTPSEVLARAVQSRVISPGGASTLVGLFTEARFSRHVMTEEHREEAERALRSVLGQLRSSA